MCLVSDFFYGDCYNPHSYLVGLIHSTVQPLSLEFALVLRISICRIEDAEHALLEQYVSGIMLWESIRARNG